MTAGTGEGSDERRRPRARLVSLDALRGAAIAGMILVNSPGSWAHVYPPLGHAEWHGWTLADMVFPAFLFAAGAALGLAFPHAADGRSIRRLWLRITRRSALLVLIGLFLNALPAFDLAHLRIPGVLQRIGLCYALAAASCILTAHRSADGRMRLDPAALIGAIVALLVGYWALMTLTPVPGFGVGRLDAGGNLAAYVDRAVFGTDHLWRWATVEGMGVAYDPEGLLSTLPATANVLVGTLAGWLLKTRPGRGSIAILGIAGVCLLVLGQALHPVFPINKRIWTSTFALVSAGFSLVLLALFAAALAQRYVLAAAYPLRALGGNAILAYVVSTIMGVYAETRFVPVAGGKAIGAQQWGFETVRAFIEDPYLASFVCALLVLGLITALIIPLERRGLHLRI